MILKMKRFKYSLENVLHYKEQILDSIKAEHGTLLAQIRKKEAEIQELENKLVSAQNKMDDLKKTGCTDKRYLSLWYVYQ